MEEELDFEAYFANGHDILLDLRLLLEGFEVEGAEIGEVEGEIVEVEVEERENGLESDVITPRSAKNL